MLTLIRSNRVEYLLAELARRLVSAPPASVFTAETVVTPSPAMARWVNLRLAASCGVAANVRYPLPASCVWGFARQLLGELPETDPLSIDAMTWRIFALLPELLPQRAFAALRHYLRDDTDGRKRWQLAARIADVFDRCQLYRPGLIRAWMQDKATDSVEHPWQPLLWQCLVAGGETVHRVAVLDRLLAHLDTPAVGAALPARLALFAVSSLPPIFVQVFQALARHIPVELYLHTPSDQFWSDLVSQKTLARRRLAQPDDADLWEVGNPLLGSWGRQGQALQDLLLEGETALEEQDAYATDWPETLLGRLQQDLFALTPVPAGPQALTPDDSVQVHVCHGPARECQVLHDRLLAMFAAEPDLRPEDVLVMVPDIGRYAPDIEAVFDRHRPEAAAGDTPDAARRYIPWNLSDIAAADEHPLVRVFLQLLALPESRFTQSEVLSYLDVPALAANFGLDADAVAQVKDWLAAANLRWGLDGAHKARLGLPAMAQNTWAQAEERVFAGYALGGEPGGAGCFAGIAPVAGVEGGAAVALGGFWRLLSRLEQAATQLAAARPAAVWQRDLSHLLADLFGERDDPDGRLQRIRDAVAELAMEAGDIDEPLSPQLVRQWLTERLGALTEHRGGRYFSGGVTFCGMRPMRSLPFPVICVLGLDAEAFPRQDRPVEFDPMRRTWRPGDPRKGDEDRYLFLETLLGARRRLHLSYVGRDARNNTERQPSVLLRELLDHIDQYFSRNDSGEPLSKAITREHALQPFSPVRFLEPDDSPNDQDHRSFDADWCRIARHMQQPAAAPAAPVDWPAATLPEAPAAMRDITLTQLERFLAHPVRYFVQTRLGVYLRDEELAPDEEPFALDSLAAWQLRTRLLEDRLAERPATAAELSAEGLLPHGAFGDLALSRQERRLAPLEDALAPYAGQRAARLDLDLTFDTDPAGPWRLTGQVGGLYPDLGLLRWRAGRLRGEDRLKLWLAHLARWAVADASLVEDPQPSVLLTEQDRFALRNAPPRAEARARLGELVALYWQGAHRPLPIFPKASFAFAECWDADDPSARERARKEAGKAWTTSEFSQVAGDGDDDYVQLMLRDVTGNPLDTPEFEQLALALYSPLLAAAEDA
ncbi:MAG: exodeoxyribonuclease V subunit gamma [Thiohalocapsa sp.]|uniref:exodeoxyribonuclease V subunit gamma n=1 Tax=Thiohalocapsa sp. TaxID=2497641 RepID=UPI0025F336DF|nr:exodeoxyribonuclease V subunit gamma [Thiohalocapsa sp.]MCG6940475.1 exodeoxyribonuclease V subunit gamma [Thiohalocapsa sp.]